LRIAVRKQNKRGGKVYGAILGILSLSKIERRVGCCGRERL